MDNIRLYEDFLDASQEDIIPQETVVAENEPEVNAQNYQFLFNFYFNLKALRNACSSTYTGSNVCSVIYARIFPSRRLSSKIDTSQSDVKSVICTSR